MCGRINIKSTMSVLMRDFQLSLAPDELPEWEPRYNIPPTINIPVVRQLLLKLVSEQDQMFALANSILASPAPANIHASAEELRETVVDLRANVESRLERLSSRR